MKNIEIFRRNQIRNASLKCEASTFISTRYLEPDLGSCSLFDIIHLSWSSHERRSKHISSHFLMDTNLVIENYCMTLLQLDRRYALFEFKKYKHFCFLHFLTLSIYEHVLRYITTRTNHCFITKKLKLNLTRKCCSNISILYFSV